MSTPEPKAEKNVRSKSQWKEIMKCVKLMEAPYVNAGFKSSDDYREKALIQLAMVCPQELTLEGWRMTLPVKVFEILRPLLSVKLPWKSYPNPDGCLHLIPPCWDALYELSMFSQRRKLGINIPQVAEHFIFTNASNRKIALPAYLCSLVGIENKGEIILCGGGTGRVAGGAKLAGVAWLEIWSMRKRRQRDLELLDLAR